MPASRSAASESVDMPVRWCTCATSKLRPASRSSFKNKRSAEAIGAQRYIAARLSTPSQRKATRVTVGLPSRSRRNAPCGRSAAEVRAYTCTSWPAAARAVDRPSTCCSTPPTLSGGNPCVICRMRMRARWRDGSSVRKRSLRTGSHAASLYAFRWKVFDCCIAPRKRVAMVRPHAWFAGQRVSAVSSHAGGFSGCRSCPTVLRRDSPWIGFASGGAAVSAAPFVFPVARTALCRFSRPLS